jgi:hypothetical protein
MTGQRRTLVASTIGPGERCGIGRIPYFGVRIASIGAQEVH